MKYIKTFESYNTSGKDDEIIEYVLELISLRNDDQNIEHFVKRKEYPEYLCYSYDSGKYILIKNIIENSKLVDINNNPYNNSHFDIINYDINYYDYKLDVNKELANKLYNKLLQIKSMSDEQLYIDNTKTTKKTLNRHIDNEVKKNMSEIGL